MPTELKLELVSLRNAPRTHGLPALGWLANKTVSIVKPFHLIFLAKERVMHEVEHDVAGLGNEMHDGHTWHFCIRSWHALRIRRLACVSPQTEGIAERLLSEARTYGKP